jgi:hypothetical protein
LHSVRRGVDAGRRTAPWAPQYVLTAGNGTVAEIRIAKRTGFCYGVREAIDKAKESSAAAG